MGLTLTAAGAEALSGGLGFLGNLGGSVGGGLFGANQARKNRAFQERMYKKQVEDNLNFWNLQNDYNLPSAQLARLQEAGLNPLLAYGEGGNVANVATGSPDSAQAPHGAQAQAGSFNTRLEMANLALVEAQAKLANSQANKNDVESEESKQRTLDIEQDVILKRLTKDMNVAIRYRDYDFLNTSIDQMRNEVYNSKQLMLQNVLTLMQGREYQIKHYHLSEYEVGQSILQGWENVKTNKIIAQAHLREAAASMLHAAIAQKIMPYQIGVLSKNASLLSEQAKTEGALRHGKVLSQKWQNVNYVFDMLTKGANLNKIQAETLKTQFETLKSSLGYDGFLGGILAPFTMPLNYKKHGSFYEDLKNQTGW